MDNQEILELEIIDIALGGEGVARKDNLVIFVKNAIPGEIVKAKIIQRKKNYLNAVKVETVKSPDYEIKSKCSAFSQCGGCRFQNVPYELQLEWKEKTIKDALRKVGGFADLKIEKIIRSPKEWYYRNKIELSCGLDENSNVCLGYHKQGDYAYILPIKECTIFSESFPEIIEVLNNYLKRNKIDNFDNQLNPNGYLQYVVIRKSEFLGSLMLNFITRNKPLPDIQGLIDDLNKVNPNVSIFHTINNGGVGYSSSIDVEMKRIYGAEFIEEKIGHLQFNITPFSFFQVNTLGAFQLYGVIKKFVSTNKNARVVDLYCGTGTIGQFISSEVKEVVGIEISKEAIASAKENLKINNIENCSYIAGDARKVLKFNMPLFKGADIVITDPPRAGMSKKALSRLLEIRSKVIIYVSCNPATLARDLRDIVEGGYSITEIQPVDMFPHTPHVETVVKLCKNKIKLDNI